MDEKGRQAKNEYYRQWRRKNPEKVRESNRKYWEKKAARKEAEKHDTAK